MRAPARIGLAEPVHLLRRGRARRGSRGGPAARSTRATLSQVFDADEDVDDRLRVEPRHGGAADVVDPAGRPARRSLLRSATLSRSKSMRPARVVGDDPNRLVRACVRTRGWPWGCRCSRGPRGSRRRGRGRPPRSGSRRCRGGRRGSRARRRSSSSSASIRRARPRAAVGGGDVHALHLGDLVSRWRTPPSPAGSPSTRTSSSTPSGGTRSAGGPAAISASMSRSMSQRPVRLADEGVEERPHLGVVWARSLRASNPLDRRRR